MPVLRKKLRPLLDRLYLGCLGLQRLVVVVKRIAAAAEAGSKAFEKLGIGGGFKIGPRVDPSGELLDGRSFRDVREFQNLIADDPNLLLENMARQFLIYGTGRDVSFSDRDAVAGIVSRTAAAGGGLHTLIREVVGSELFQTP